MVTDGRLSGALRWVVAAVVVLFFLYWSFFAAYMIGWDLRPPGWHRVTDVYGLGPLITSVGLGLIGIMSARVILRRSLVSAWLLLAVPIPVVGVFDQGLDLL